MSKIKNLTLQHFTDHFLTPEASQGITTLVELLDLPLSTFKTLNQSDIPPLAKIDLKTIRDLSQLTPEGFESCIDKTHLEPKKLQRIFVACKLIFLASQKQPPSIKKPSTKVIFVGLDNAGKSSLINMLSGKKITESVNLEPTAMINQVSIAFQELDLIVWDFGGQESYRQMYLQNPEEYLSQISLVIYVIDTLDSQRYDESFSYFSQFLEPLTNLNENPYVLVLLHKVDPDIQTDPEFQINLEYLYGRLRKILQPVKFRWEIVTSSIYNSFHTQPLIAGLLKDTFNTQQINEGNILLFDAMVKMNEVLVQIGNKLMRLEEEVHDRMKVSDQKLYIPPNASSPPPSLLGWPVGVSFPPPPGWSEQSSGSLKKELKSSDKDKSYGEILGELQEIFKKRGIIE